MRLAGQAGEAVRRLAGRAGAGLLAALGIPLSRHTALRLLLRLPLPEVAVPRVLGAGDFALRRGQVYATILIDAQTGQRVDVLASRKADVLETWLRSHPGVQIVCRDGSGAYGKSQELHLMGEVCPLWPVSRLSLYLGSATRVSCVTYGNCMPHPLDA